MKPGARFELPAPDVVFSQDARATAGELFDSFARRSDAEVFFTGWDSPRLDEEVLRQAPRLRAVFHAAGSVRGIVTPEFWERDIVICSAWRINARPVAEFVLAQIIFALKHAPFRSRRMHAGRTKPDGFDSPGASGSTVGIVGLGAIGRGVLQLLHSLEVRVVAFDPCLTDEDAAQLRVVSVGFDALFRESDVVSLHVPAIDSTRHMVGEAALRAMKPGATLINTARGSVVDEESLLSVFEERGDIFAMLDVTDPDPPRPDSRLYDHPNVWLTPHIAGSVGRECLRMGDAMVDEARRYLRGEPLLHRLTRQQAEAMT